MCSCAYFFSLFFLLLTVCSKFVSHNVYNYQFLGWGSQHELSNASISGGRIDYTPPDDLQEIDVPIVTKAHCRKFHGKEISDLVFCGGDHNQDTMTSCLGDSGSPLTCRKGISKKPIIAGIVIGGDYFCRTGNQYMLFTEVSKYITWIVSHLKK